MLQTWLYHADLLGLVAGRLAGVPHILWNVRSSDMVMGRYGPLSRLTLHACRFAARYPDGIVVNSRAGYDHHRRLGYRARAWFFIPNGIDLDRFRPDAAARARVRGELGIPPEAPLIGFVARVDPMKDHETFLRAAALLARRRPDAWFLLAARGPSPAGASTSWFARPLSARGSCAWARGTAWRGSRRRSTWLPRCPSSVKVFPMWLPRRWPAASRAW